ncbi:MAG: PH domain-containing protein [Candidatus Pacebacteria bacterium]|nr:PH domain-containing protein [Candidatus Paceibacterota bacterium]
MINLNQEEKPPVKMIVAYIVTKTIIILLITYIFLSIFNTPEFLICLLGLFLIPILSIMVISRCLHVSSVKFLLNEDKIQIKSGTVFKKIKIIPYSKIQSVDIKYGLLRSWLGLSTINLWTSSQGQVSGKEVLSDGRLILLKKDAEEISNFIISKKEEQVNLN